MSTQAGSRVYKAMVAREKSDGSAVIYPPSLPKDRGNTAQMGYISLIIILLSVGGSKVFYEEGTKEMVVYVVTGMAVGILLFALLHIASRACLLAEEIHHIPGRYPDRKSAAFQAFMFNKKCQSIFIVSFVYAMIFWIMWKNPFTYVWSKGPMAITFFYASFFISKLTVMDESILETSLQIERIKSLDYGSGMAYNYFYGYLRLVLPDPETGYAAKGIKKRIETFINFHHLGEDSFPIKKLVILIPQNLYTPSDLRDVSVDFPDNDKYWMEAAVSLEPQELDRAGVKQRVYKNSVYKIKNRDHPGKPVYVVAEGATPLKTLYDVIKMNPKISCVFKDHQCEIVSAFYKTLRNIIKESDDCRDVCEIIYYVDTDKYNKPVNIAKIILERIRELTGTGNVQ